MDVGPMDAADAHLVGNIDPDTWDAPAGARVYWQDAEGRQFAPQQEEQWLMWHVSKQGVMPTAHVNRPKDAPPPPPAEKTHEALEETAIRTLEETREEELREITAKNDKTTNYNIDQDPAKYIHEELERLRSREQTENDKFLKSLSTAGTTLTKDGVAMNVPDNTGNSEQPTANNFSTAVADQRFSVPVERKPRFS